MQPKFELEAAKAHLVHINPRTEKHGEQDKPAADLKFHLTESNGILAMFNPTLRHHLYEKDDANEQLEGVEALTRLRFGSLITRIRIGHALKGADVVIGFGLGGAGSDISLDTVDVDGFNVDLMEGGSVGLTFRVKARPTGEQIKRLYEVLGGEVDITVTPAIEKQGSLGLPTSVE